MKTIRFFGLLMVLCVSVLLICSCSSQSNSDGASNSAKVIDAKKYITINYGKYDGYSSPEILVDFEGLSTNIDSETYNKFKDNFSSEMRWELAMYDNMADVFDIEFSEDYQNVSNGDKITVKISANSYLESEGITLDRICKELSVKFNKTEIQYTVSGLESAENIIDIFEGIEQYIVYKGANGNGRIGYGQIEIPKDYSRQVGDLYFSKGDWANSVKIIHNNSKIGEITYYIEGEKLSGGDVIEITTSCPVDELEDLGYIVSATRKNTTVPDLGEYLENKEQLTAEVIEAIKKRIVEERAPTEICEIYYAKCKPGVECKYNSTSSVFAITYKEGVWTGNRYYIESINDIIIKPDGTIEVSYESVSYSSETIEDARGRFSTDNYDFELVVAD